MTKADFYIGSGKDGVEPKWIGSIYSDGYPEGGIIPAELFLQVNKIMFEEMVTEVIIKNNGALADRGDKWPWLWLDSQVTDYTYMFDINLNRVIASNHGREFFDPIKVIQGEDLESANLAMGRPDFPRMVKDYG
jgi:hypothetical protein